MPGGNILQSIAGQKQSEYNSSVTVTELQTTKSERGKEYPNSVIWYSELWASQAINFSPAASANLVNSNFYQG
jgi:hypothetical protein